MWRTVSEDITFDNHLKHYFLFWRGDEILIEATNDEEALTAGAALKKELEAADE